MVARTTKTPFRSKRSEHVEQREFISWWRKTQPDLIFAIPNGGKRSKVAAHKLQLEGVVSGVLDLFCPERLLWIEFKRADGGRLSPSQKEFASHMIEIGHRVMVAWGCDDAIRQIEQGERESWVRPKD